eukprot:4879683-Pleurochrysis_carterae.AAC.3
MPATTARTRPSLQGTKLSLLGTKPVIVPRRDDAVVPCLGYTGVASLFFRLCGFPLARLPPRRSSSLGLVA